MWPRLEQQKVQGALDRRYVTTLVARNRNRFGFCYEEEWRHDPMLEGNVAADFTIDETGRVTWTRVKGLNEAVERCLTELLRRMRFPAPTNGGLVEVSYVFTYGR